ncbi:type IV conjugative transfer system protein TraE [Pseudoduganella lurida]|uniref:Type IV conjugative transfer system protein TraE n=1 Tax=Pseudoduganella lurida TaxID=1036180 RepID=A0A562RJP9_9BURK|nr:TraE/TraK family type IV conjugative transfer system protein [Pseudoduganella lurida]TWI69287.1 type IV conjugative transfer system protein TraE [Pseudoduganella lurida]
MDGDEFINALDKARSGIRKLQVALGGCIVLAIVQACSIARQAGNERQYFLPPEISRPFWLAGAEASPEYFEDLGQFINGLPLNVTPDTVDAACRQYLKYVVARDRARYKGQCDVETARIKRDGVAQTFSVREMHTDAHRRRVVLDGVLTTLVNDKPFRAPQTYLIEFEYSDGRFYVSKHDKVTPHDPHTFKP